MNDAKNKTDSCSKDKQIKLLQAKLLVAEHDARQLERSLKETQAEFSRINAELVSVYQSSRWRITQPLSNIKQLVKKTAPETSMQSVKQAEGIALETDKKYALVLDRSVPTPDKDAGSRAMLGYMRILQDLGYQVLMMGEDFALPEPYVGQLQEEGMVVLGGEYYQDSFEQWLRSNGAAIDVVVLSRPNVAKRYMALVKQYTQAIRIYMGQDLHFLRMEREQQVENKLSNEQIELMKATEFVAMSEADATLMYSDVERQRIVEEFDLAADTVPLYYYKNVPERQTEFSQTKNLLFVGGFGHQPNVDAAAWLAQDIFALLREQLPDVRLYIVGAHPTDEVQELAASDIVVTGFVSDEELQHYYQTCRVCVVPLRYGAGVKGKTLEAMYYGIPVVSTAIGTEGMPAIGEVIPPANTAQEIAQQITQIYKDENDWRSRSQSERIYLLENYSYDSAKKIMERILHG